MPVIGITEAALLTACMLGQRFGMITFGRQTRQMYFDLAADYGMVSRLAECRTIDVSSLTQYLDPNAMANLITTEAKAIAEETDARSVIICGAAIAGMARTPATGGTSAPNRWRVLCCASRRRARTGRIFLAPGLSGGFGSGDGRNWS